MMPGAEKIAMTVRTAMAIRRPDHLGPFHHHQPIGPEMRIFFVARIQQEVSLPSDTVRRLWPYWVDCCLPVTAALAGVGGESSTVGTTRSLAFDG